MPDVLVVFHSRTGHCRDLARLMSEQRGWALAEVAWPGGQPSYAQCAKEAILRGHPAIRYQGPDPTAYDVVVLVSPVWCWRLCPPMRSFIRSMQGKLGGVAVLSCMGGSGASNAVAEVEQLIHRPVVARLALRRQTALHTATLRFGLALGARAIDHFLLLVHADDEVPDHLIHHLQAAIQFLHQLAGAVDHFEHVHALFVPRDLVRQALPAPVFGLLDRAVHARDDRVDLLVQLGDLLFGGVGGDDVDELVLSICHDCSFRTR